MQEPKQAQAQQYALTAETMMPLRLLACNRTLSSFTDLELHAGPYQILSETEAKVILDIALLVLNSLEQAPTQGTFRIYGQRHQHQPELILSAHLNYGACARTMSGDGLSSDEVINQSMLAVKRKLVNSKAGKFAPWYNGEQEFPEGSNIYLPVGCGGNQFMLLQTTFGCFYIHIHTNSAHCVSDSEETMWAIGQTLACLRPADTVLQAALADGYKLVQAVTGDRAVLTAMEIVQELFQTCGLKSLQEWHNVYQINMVMRHDEPLYFDTLG